MVLRRNYEMFGFPATVCWRARDPTAHRLHKPEANCTACFAVFSAAAKILVSCKGQSQYLSLIHISEPTRPRLI
eukprot:1292682-Amphidinium_carterae.1